MFKRTKYAAKLLDKGGLIGECFFYVKNSPMSLLQEQQHSGGLTGTFTQPFKLNNFIKK